MTQLTSNIKISKRTNILLKYSGYIVFLVLGIFFSIISPSFFKLQNLINILNQCSVLAIAAAGMTIILIGGGTHVIQGGIDLSLGNNLAIISTITAVLISKNYSFFTILMIIVSCSLFIGLINAFLIVKLRIIPLLATLSMMYLLQGVELLISGNKPINVSNPILSFLSNGNFLFLPSSVWVFILVEIILYLLLNRSVFGNWINAVGGNPKAAMVSGINVNFILSVTYIIASIVTMIASLLATARLSGSVPGTGDVMLFDILLAAYMSAVFSRTFIPNIPGAILSSLFVEMLTNGFTLINVPTYWVYAVKGALILLTVAISTKQQRGLEQYV